MSQKNEWGHYGWVLAGNQSEDAVIAITIETRDEWRRVRNVTGHYTFDTPKDAEHYAKLFSDKETREKMRLSGYLGHHLAKTYVAGHKIFTFIQQP